jgi:two-component system OmpR family sensor kinase
MRVIAWLRLRSIEVGWGLFALGNLAAMALWEPWETVPFHFIWVSLTLVYGFRVWRVGATLTTLSVVFLATGALILLDVHGGSQLVGELFEVPLMSAMFLAMVWHAPPPAAGVTGGRAPGRGTGLAARAPGALSA